VSIARSPIEFPELIKEGDHLVQFYKNESHLAETVSNFVAPALWNGEGVVLIATSAHLEAFEHALNLLYINTTFLKLTKQLIMLDVNETLKKFMLNNLPDRNKFDEVFGPLMTEMKGQYQVVKVYGELVNELWTQGNLTATMELEALWNDLLKWHDFTLLCAYSLESLSEEKQGIVFTEICQCHSHVIPAEGIIETDDHKDQLRRIAELQFKMSSGAKSFNEWKKNTLEMMIPLTALKIHLRELKNQAVAMDVKSLVMKCEHQIDRMARITENLYR
jgi:hypothetical protein